MFVYTINFSHVVKAYQYSRYVEESKGSEEVEEHLESWRHGNPGKEEG